MPMLTDEAVHNIITGALASGREVERERCIKIVEPKREKPCDCIEENANGVWLWSCNCHNDGDLSAATSWCEAMNYAATIRNLKD